MSGGQYIGLIIFLTLSLGSINLALWRIQDAARQAVVRLDQLRMHAEMAAVRVAIANDDGCIDRCRCGVHAADLLSDDTCPNCNHVPGKHQP